MYKLFFWDSIDISIRGVVVPDNDIGIEETLDHEKGICYDVINFTYPDSRIGRYLAANFWFVRWKPKRITCARGRQPFAGLEFYCNNNNYGGEKFFPIPICRVQFKSLQVHGWGGGKEDRATVRWSAGAIHWRYALPIN